MKNNTIVAATAVSATKWKFKKASRPLAIIGYNDGRKEYIYKSNVLVDLGKTLTFVGVK